MARPHWPPPSMLGRTLPIRNPCSMYAHIRTHMMFSCVLCVWHNDLGPRGQSATKVASQPFPMGRGLRAGKPGSHRAGTAPQPASAASYIRRLILKCGGFSPVTFHLDPEPPAPSPHQPAHDADLPPVCRADGRPFAPLRDAGRGRRLAPRPPAAALRAGIVPPSARDQEKFRLEVA
jgi:hypothetical protein